MRFETGQHMRLNQQMKLAPRMIQSMEILQMPMLELQERIEQELESNIALELVEPGGDADASNSSDDDRGDDRLDSSELNAGDDTTDWERLSVLESSYRDAFDNEYSSSKYAGERDRKMDAMANVAARGKGLTEQLLEQWSFAEVEPGVAARGEIIIGYIDDDGFLAADVDTIVEQNAGVPGLDLDAESIEKTIDVLQRSLEPAGVAARNKRESFQLQIEHLELRDEEGHDWNAVRVLIDDHFEDLLENRLPRISAESGLSIDEIQAAMMLMRKLDLSPARHLVDNDVPPVIPDVIIEFDEDRDEYFAYLPDGRLPQLRISDRYEAMAKDRAQDKSTREFVTSNVQRAQWLLDSLVQRQNTLLRVVNVVLARQREYFDQGEQHLKSLPMIDVADQLGIHVGTVSRAVSEKWMQTPRGMVPLRRFFSGGTATDSGRDMSWDAVKATLKEIIEAEDKTKPMSDEALATALRERGIDIARRTVVKYRQQLDIPPARRRKVYAS